MSIWPKAFLGDLCHSIVDGDHQSLPLAETGIPFITISDISNNRIGFTHARYVPHDYYDKLDPSRKPEKGAVLYSVKGSFGIPVYVDFDDPFTFQRDIAILKCKTVLNPHYLYYVLKSPEYYRLADLLAIGSAQRALTLKTLKNIEVPVPPREIQDRFVSILSAYDDLIETNQRQIKLLEEAAQRLYKEWFVDLQYPGHENVPVVDGVPEGWTVGLLGDVAQFRRGQMITKAQVSDGNVPVVAGGLEPSCYHNKANTVAPVVTVSGSGANAGFTRLYNVDVFASDCSFIDRDTTPYLFFVYCYLRDNRLRLDSLQKGSAQPHVYAKDLNALSLMVPSASILQAFCNRARPCFERIGVLQQEIVLSSQARDRLLPKLMSGEIAV